MTANVMAYNENDGRLQLAGHGKQGTDHLFALAHPARRQACMHVVGWDGLVVHNPLVMWAGRRGCGPASEDVGRPGGISRLRCRQAREIKPVCMMWEGGCRCHNKTTRGITEEQQILVPGREHRLERTIRCWVSNHFDVSVEALTLKKVHPASEATAFASIVWKPVRGEKKRERMGGGRGVR